MRKKTKGAYVYLYTKSCLKPNKRGLINPKTKLRVKAIAEGRELSAALPLLVTTQFSTFYHSDGRLRPPYEAVSLIEKIEKAFIAAAYRSAKRVAAFMLSIPDYWEVAPKYHFAAALTIEFEAECNKQDGWVSSNKREAAKAAEEGIVPSLLIDIAEWRRAKGIGGELPGGNENESWKEYLKEWSNSAKEKNGRNK